MSKRVYISADYSENDGDRDVVNELHKWSSSNKYSIEFVDTAEVVSGSVSKDSDCRACDLKTEFNKQINASSIVIFIIGDKTAYRTAGSICDRTTGGPYCRCTPYKQNTKGVRSCKNVFISNIMIDNNVGNINNYSYIEHEFRQAVQKNKRIIIVYNSLIREPRWLPNYMKNYEAIAHPFWIRNVYGNVVGDYSFIKRELENE